MTLSRIPHTYDFLSESWSNFSSVSGLKSSIGLSVTFSIDFRQKRAYHVRHLPEQYKAVKPKGTLNMNDN